MSSDILAKCFTDDFSVDTSTRFPKFRDNFLTTLRKVLKICPKIFCSEFDKNLCYSVVMGSVHTIQFLHPINL